MRSKTAILVSIALVGMIAYIPALDNFFISDDFVILSRLKTLSHDPADLFRVPLEWFRLTSYFFFAMCQKLFGLNSVGFYLAGISLHAIVSVLVYILIARMAGNRLAAGPGAVFFAAYERHQEAVMWLAAINEILLTLTCLLCLNPLKDDSDRQWHDYTLDLARWEGRTGYLVLECAPGPRGDDTADWLAWSPISILKR